MDLTHQTLPVVLAIVGAICFLAGVLGQVSTNWFQFGLLGRPMRWILGVGGIVFIAAAVYVYLHQPSPPIVQNVQPALSPQTGAAQTPSLPSAPATDPETLIKVIMDRQHEQVGDSTGTLAYQCFTEPKLAEFKKARIPAQVAEDLKKDAGFIDLVLAIKAMAPAARQNLLDRAAKTYRQPWSQLNLDPATASKSDLLRGQTDAGSEAERAIAESIVAQAKDLSRRSEDELKKLNQ